MKFSYNTTGTCAQVIEFELTEDNKVDSVKFFGGCPGNLLAMSKLVKNRPVDEVIDVLTGIRCGNKSTSCADQLAQALRASNSKQNT